MIIENKNRIENNDVGCKISLHPRLSRYVIEVTVHTLKKTAEVHTETNFLRAKGVFFFLVENEDIAIEMATQLIEQRDFKENGIMEWDKDVERALKPMSRKAVQPTRETLIEFIKEVARYPHPDSDLASLLETLQKRAAAILGEMGED